MKVLFWKQFIPVGFEDSCEVKYPQKHAVQEGRGTFVHLIFDKVSFLYCGIV